MPSKEATARIKINKLLEAAGWRFLPEGDATANVQLEPKVKIKKIDLDAMGDDFEKTANGFVDFHTQDRVRDEQPATELVCLVFEISIMLFWQIVMEGNVLVG